MPEPVLSYEMAAYATPSFALPSVLPSLPLPTPYFLFRVVWRLLPDVVRIRHFLTPLQSSEHGACPVIRGQKWAANLWVWNGPRYGMSSVDPETGRTVDLNRGANGVNPDPSFKVQS